MTDLLKKINKYIILMIISSLFGMPWIYVRHLIFDFNNPETFTLVDLIPKYIDYLIRFVVIILLIIDFKKENFKYIVITCIAAFFYPLLGIIIFSLLYLEKVNEKASA